MSANYKESLERIFSGKELSAIDRQDPAKMQLDQMQIRQRQLRKALDLFLQATSKIRFTPEQSKSLRKVIDLYNKNLLEPQDEGIRLLKKQQGKRDYVKGGKMEKVLKKRLEKLDKFKEGEITGDFRDELNDIIKTMDRNMSFPSEDMMDDIGVELTSRERSQLKEMEKKYNNVVKTLEELSKELGRFQY